MSNNRIDPRAIENEFYRRLKAQPGTLQRHPIDGTMSAYLNGKLYTDISAGALAQLKRSS